MSGTTSSNTIEEFEPATKVVIIQLGLTAGLAVVLLGLFSLNRGMVGGGDLANIILSVIAFVFVLAILRLLIKVVVLSRTTYVLTPDDLRLEYALFYKTKTREIPLEQLRGMELNQNRIQSALGFGTLVFLTGGMNQSLGFIEFQNILNPESVRDTVRAQAD